MTTEAEKAVILYAFQKKNSQSISEEDFNKIKGISPTDVSLAVDNEEKKGRFIVAAGIGSDKVWYLSPDGKRFARTLLL